MFKSYISFIGFIMLFSVPTLGQLTWSKTALPDSGILSSNAVSLYRLSSGKLIMHSNRGIILKEPNKPNWRKIYEYPATAQVNNKFYQQPNGTIITNIGIPLKSSDDGESWQYDSLENVFKPFSPQFHFMDSKGNQYISNLTDSLYLKPLNGRWKLDTIRLRARMIEDIDGNIYALRDILNCCGGTTGTNILKLVAGKWLKVKEDTALCNHFTQSVRLITDKEGTLYISSGYRLFFKKYLDTVWNPILLPSFANIDSSISNYTQRIAVSEDKTLFVHVPFSKDKKARIFMTRDYGKNWTDAGINWDVNNMDFDNYFIKELVCFKDSVFVVDGNGNNLYVAKINQLSNSSNIEITDKFGELFPNPVNSSGSFKIHLADSDNIKIDIYDIIGKSLFQFEDFKTIGEHLIGFNTEGWHTGIYVYQLRVGNKIQIGKFVVKK